jgi:AcrR family transcriptional regulator
MPRAERERLILDVGERLFAERGYDRVSMDEVAAGAGVTKPMIYAYFDSKDGLFAAGIHRAYERGTERAVAAAAGAKSILEVAARMTEAFFDFVDEHRDVWPLIFGAQAVGGRAAEEAHEARMGLVRTIAAQLEKTLPSPAPAELEPLAEISVAVLMSLADRWIRNPGESRELEVRRAQEILGPPIARLAAG